MKAPLPPDEAARLEALRDYDILDTPPEPLFDDLTLLASQICGTPMALVTLLDEHRQWFKSKIGLAGRETPRDSAFCAYSILQTDVMAVEDATLDERFADNPLVTGDPHIRFYAGAPLITPGGHALGTLCVIDRVPRQLDEGQIAALEALGRQVVVQLELRRHIALLQTSEESLRLLNSAVVQSKEAILITDAEIELPGPRIVFVNPAFTHLTGYSSNELIGRTPRILHGPRTDWELMARLKNCLVTGTLFEGEGINYRKDGSEFVMEWQIAPIRDVEGAITHFVATQRDITERKQMETLVRQSENEQRQLAVRLVATQAVGKIGSWETDLTTMGLIWSEETHRIFQTNPDSFHPSYQAFLDLVHQEDREGLDLAFRNSFNKDQAQSFEHQILLPDGRTKMVEERWRILHDDHGKAVRAVGSCQDITERKQAESAVRESEAKFRQLADNITDAFWIRSADMKTLHYLSAGYEKIWGRPIGDMHANPHNWAEAILPEDRERVTAVYATLMKNKPQTSVEYRITRPDASIRWVQARGFQVRDATGKLVRLMGIVTDITVRKEIETQLFHAQKMETVGKLAGGVAHEFNSIMTAILGQSELLLADLPSGSPLMKKAQEISTAATRAAALTQQLLAYGRKQILQPKILQLNTVLDEMDHGLRHILRPDIDMQILPATELGTVKADLGQIEQMITNIVVNANDAMPRGGKLTLETANVALADMADFPDLLPGDYVRLTITDTGIGMSETILGHIFDPFFSTKGIGQGTGLGLSTCYGIVKQSGGHIAVQSVVGEGSRFEIYLPQVAQAMNDGTPPASTAIIAKATETILLVEEDTALREMAGILLGKAGYIVLTAASGLAALSLAQRVERGPIHLLVTDPALSGMAGDNLAAAILAHHPETAVLYTSAQTNSTAAPGDFLQKPFSPAALIRKVRETLDQPPQIKPGG